MTDDEIRELIDEKIKAAIEWERFRIARLVSHIKVPMPQHGPNVYDGTFADVCKQIAEAIFGGPVPK